VAFRRHFGFPQGLSQPRWAAGNSPANRFSDSRTPFRGRFSSRSCQARSLGAEPGSGARDFDPRPSLGKIMSETAALFIEQIDEPENDRRATLPDASIPPQHVRRVY
jgi:hypothetical protein